MIKEYWKTKESIIGLLGVAPYATIDFLKKISDLTPAEKDWDHIRIILDSNTKIPSRGRALDLGEENPVKYMRESIIGLDRAGAKFVIILCNTAHIYYDEVVKGLNVNVLNMIGETINYIIKNTVNVKSSGILGSNNTIKYKLYNKYNPQNSKIRMYYPDIDQKIVSQTIESIKLGNDNIETKNQIINMANKFIKDNQLDSIVLGCTELSVIIKDGDLSVPVFDSSEILAKVAIEKIKNEK